MSSPSESPGDFTRSARLGAFDSANPRHCKQVMADTLIELGLPPYRLTARTIGFVDLARRSMVFVTIHDWTAGSRWSELAAVARRHDFRIEAR